MQRTHLMQLHKITDGMRSWCGRLFGYLEDGYEPDDDPRITMNYEGATCFTCLWAFDAFCNKYKEE